MSTVTLCNFDLDEVENLQQFEKIRRSNKVVMPAHRCSSAISASHKTPSSKSNSRRISRSKGGQHQRRLKKFR